MYVCVSLSEYVCTTCEVLGSLELQPIVSHHVGAVISSSIFLALVLRLDLLFENFGHSTRQCKF